MVIYTFGGQAARKLAPNTIGGRNKLANVRFRVRHDLETVGNLGYKLLIGKNRIAFTEERED